MSFSLSNRALLRGILASAVVLTGTACSRSDRTESGRDTSATVLDTSSTTTGVVTDTGAVTDTATGGAPSRSPRAETATPSSKDTAGYRAMERDTTNMPSQHSDSATVTPDTNVSSVPSDTSPAEVAVTADTGVRTEVSADSTAIDASVDVADTSSTEMAAAADAAGADVSADTSAVAMARDTSTAPEPADTAATPSGDVAIQATDDTSSQANAGVSAETEVAVAGTGDSTDNAGRIRPPEDSTEILGQDSTEILGNATTTDEVGDETADEQVVRPEDRETVAASEARTDEVGAAAIGGDVTGAEAVALLSREGVRCAVVDPEVNEAMRWNMSDTPVMLNPCGMGSMILSRIWTRVE